MHTKTPWLISSSTIVCDENARMIANCTPIDMIVELQIPLFEAIDNARLIASAPELLEALKAALEWIDTVPKDTILPAMPGFDRDWVNSVITKAEGK